MIDPNRKSRKNRASLYRVLLPAIIFSQLLFVLLLNRNLKQLGVLPLGTHDSETNLRGLDTFQQTTQEKDSLPQSRRSLQEDTRAHKLLDRLRQERDEIEKQKNEDFTPPQSKETENWEEEEPAFGKNEESKSQPSIGNEGASEAEDWMAAVQDFEEKGWDEFESPWEEEERTNDYPEFGERLVKLRNELLETAASGIKTHGDGGISPSTKNNPEHFLAKTPPDQPIEFLIPILSPPRITSTGTETIILVPSHQGSFVKRQAIRETWMAAAKHNTTVTVLFVVAQSNCQEFELDMDSDARVSNATNSSVKSNSSWTCDQIDHEFLKLEQDKNQDLLEIPMKEEYRRLPEKMMQAYNWALKNLPNLKWAAKADDDMFVDVQILEGYVRKYNSEVPIVIGDIVHHSRPAQEGKWAEPDYPQEFYPYWPKGSAGHVLSRSLLKYFTENSESLHRYQGEDTSIGIWMDEARKSKRLNDVTYIHAPESFISSGLSVCRMGSQFIMVGHELTPSDQMLCQERANTKGIMANSWIDAPSNFEKLIEEEES